MEREYQDLKARWLSGERDRTLCLHLMFFAWMHWADPPFVTGLTDDPGATKLWHEIFAFMGGETSGDTEFLFTAGLMAELFSYALGDETEWAKRGEWMKTRALAGAIPSATFNDRSEYGRYFAHQLLGHRRQS